MGKEGKPEGSQEDGKETEHKSKHIEFQNKKEKEELESLRKLRADLLGKKLESLEELKRVDEYICAIDEERKLFEERLLFLCKNSPSGKMR